MNDTIDNGQDNQNNNENQRELAVGDTPDFKWYILKVTSGQENKIVSALKDKIFFHGLQGCFSDILVPEETLTSNLGGKKKTIKRKFFPGYVIVKMIMNQETWHLVHKINKVSGFLGGTKENPLPISEEEAALMTSQIKDGFKKAKSSVSLTEGESVKVIEGPFASFVGTVESISEKGKVKVNVSIFGRPTPVELEFSQIEKVSN